MLEKGICLCCPCNFSINLFKCFFFSRLFFFFGSLPTVLRCLCQDEMDCHKLFSDMTQVNLGPGQCCGPSYMR